MCVGYLVCGGFVCMCFLFNCMIWLLNVVMLLGLCEISIIGMLSCVCSLVSLWCMCWCIVLLSVVNGLLSSRMCGCVISVCVSVMCCFCLFDNCDGYCFVSVLRLNVCS